MEGALGEEGALTAEADHEKGKVTVSCDPDRTGVDALEAAITSVGYSVDVAEVPEAGSEA